MGNHIYTLEIKIASSDILLQLVRIYMSSHQFRLPTIRFTAHYPLNISQSCTPATTNRRPSKLNLASVTRLPNTWLIQRSYASKARMTEATTEPLAGLWKPTHLKALYYGPDSVANYLLSCLPSESSK